MCHQSVGLVQSVIEKSGIPTVSITLLREVTARVKPPRALVVDRPLGYPLGEPGNARCRKRSSRRPSSFCTNPSVSHLSMSSERFHLSTSALPAPKNTNLICG